MVFQYQAPATVSSRLDPIEDQILLGFYEGKTLVEIGAATGRSFAGIRKKAFALQDAGYLEYNPGKARGRTLTEQGKMYLRANGFLKQEVFAP